MHLELEGKCALGEIYRLLITCLLFEHYLKSLDNDILRSIVVLWTLERPSTLVV